MASLREIKDRIGSVRSTLKITSAMKLVASAKLRKAQKAIEGLRPYEDELNAILSELSPSSTCRTESGPVSLSACTGKVAVVAIASNSSLCGGFNADVVRSTLELLKSCPCEVEVHSLGRKMAEAMRRVGYESPADYYDLIAHPTYRKAADLAESLVRRCEEGELSAVVLVYTRFISTSRHQVVAEPFAGSLMPAATVADGTDEERSIYIVEPGRDEVVAEMGPQVTMLRFYAAILDSAASEHAARTVAMQTASDNAEDLLAELTLEYNKGRQQKITAEILDLVGGLSQ